MSDLQCDTARMNLNKEEFEKAVACGFALCADLKKGYSELQLYPVLSRVGPGSGQCWLTTDLRKIVMDFPAMLQEVGESHKKSKKAQSNIQQLRNLLFKIKDDRPLEKEADTVERKLLDPDLRLYCDDVNIEFRGGVLKYESLQRLQQDPRLPPGLNTVGDIRVITGSLEMLAEVGG